MKKNATCFFLAIILIAGGFKESFSQLTSKESSWVRKNIKPIYSTTEATANSDLNFLNKELKGVRVFLIGESSHGTKEYYELKTKIVKYVHEKLGFDVLIMESGLGETFAAYADAKSATDTALMKRTQFQNFQCSEFLTLFSYLKEKQLTAAPLEIVGLDCQNSGNYFPVFLNALIKKIDTLYATRALANLRSAAKLPGLHKDSLAFIKTRNDYLHGLEELREFVNQKADEIQRIYPSQQKVIAYIYRVIENLYTFYNVFPGAFLDPVNRILLRDKIMSDNIFWYTDTLFPDKKIIIWAHNLHVSKNATLNGGKMMGEYVYNKFGAKAYSLGLFSLKGETYQFWDKSNVLFENTSDSSMEKKLCNYFNTTAGFLSLKNLDIGYKPTKWLFNTNQVYELEVGRWHDIIPALRHDGIIVIKNSSLPSYLK